MTCDPPSLFQSASCFTCLSNKQLLAVQTYLLAVKTGGSLDPAALFGAATPFYYLDKKQLMAICAYLLCQISNGGTPTPPQTVPTLVAGGSGVIDWTWTPASPFYWAVQNSEDGSTMWSTEINTVTGSLRTYTVGNPGLFYRIIGNDSSMNPITSFSNVVLTT